MRILLLLPLGFFSLTAIPVSASPKTGSPVDDLPPHIRQLTAFGERPDWSHDGTKLLFLSKVFGDVYEYHLSTGEITPCTDHFTHYGFTRALYLANGDILLSGPVASFDRLDKASRQHARSNSYLSVLKRSLDAPPIPLKIHCDEGPAVSRSRLLVAWTHGRQDEISAGEIVYEDGTLVLRKIRKLLDRTSFPVDERPGRWIETQNFVPPGDKLLTVTGYEVGGTANSEVFVFDIEAGTLTNVSKSPGYYEEAEGIFPDGRFTLVERAQHNGNHWPLIDAYKLALDGSGQVERMTYFTTYPGYKAGEQVISDDGRFMAFTLGKSGMEAGQGFGLFLFDIQAAGPFEQQ
jgi:hypothetical protein